MSVNTPIIKEISEQFQATLKMIDDSIVKCNDDLWQDYSHEVVISHLVYHVLYSADHNLCKTDDERQSFNGKYGDSVPPFNNPDKSYTKQQLTDYLAEIYQKANTLFTSLTLEDLTKEKFNDYFDTNTLVSNLIFASRHIMQHIGALHVRLSSLGNEPLPWVSKVYGDERDTWQEMNNKGILYIQQGKLDEAEEIYTELCAKSELAVYNYNLACVYSRTGKSEKALDSLKICFDKNKIFKNLAKTDTDLNNIRDLPVFQKLLTS